MFIETQTYVKSNNTTSATRISAIIACAMKSKHTKRVVIAVDLSRPDGQRRMEGLLRYLCSRKVHWDMRIKRSVAECTSLHVDQFPAWDIDGVIYAQPQQTQEAKDALEHLIALNIPLVALDPGDALITLPERENLAVIRTDPDSIGAIAAHCFLSQGACQSYGFVPDVLDRQWSRNRGEAFSAALRDHGVECHLFKPKTMGSNDFVELRNWLRSLPMPAGILAAYDDRALTVIEACSAEDLAIPRDVSLLSVDDDALLCENCKPTLSSICPDQERSGYAAGALLSGLLRNGCKKPHLLTMPAKSITHRQSTLMASHAGLLVQKALGYIRKNFKRGISPKTIAERLGISRTLLDLRFRELLDTSVGKTIEMERLNAACEMLKRTQATIKEISQECGYSDSFQLMHKFKRHFGMTATAYRQQHKLTSLS